MSEKSLGLGAVVAALSMGMAHHGMHLHPWNPSYIHNQSKRIDKKTAKRAMTTKERVEVRKNRAKPKE